MTSAPRSALFLFAIIALVGLGPLSVATAQTGSESAAGLDGGDDDAAFDAAADAEAEDESGDDQDETGADAGSTGDAEGEGEVPSDDPAGQGPSEAGPESRAAQMSRSDREAHSLFLSGVGAVREGRYEQALRFFEAAYELSGRVQLLYNIGHVADVLRMERRAAGAFRDYLATYPDAPNAPSIRARLRILERSVRTQEATQARADYFSELTEQEFDDAIAGARRCVPTAAETARQAESGDASAQTAPDGPESRPLYRDWRFWTAMLGTAVVAGSLAAIVAAAAR